MIALFFDRKNSRQVRSDEIYSTNFSQSIAVGDYDDEMVPTGRRIDKEGFEAFHKEDFERAKEDGHFKQEWREDKNPEWETLREEKTPIVLYLKQEQIANRCYKSEKCPKHQNWDLCCNENDLIFLKLVDE